MIWRIAFAIPLATIYMLVVWQFGNFSIPAVIMASIPLTMLRILPGYWLLSVEFTTTKARIRPIMITALA
jgi:multidrug efflux pump subunit AcrB